MKGPTIDEIAALARAMRDHCKPIRPRVTGELLDTCGTFVLINAKKGEIESAAKEIGRLDEVVEVYSIAGEYDLIAKVRVEEYERLAEVVTQKIQKIPGIERTRTLMAFKTYKLE